MAEGTRLAAVALLTGAVAGVVAGAAEARADRGAVAPRRVAAGVALVAAAAAVAVRVATGRYLSGVKFFLRISKKFEKYTAYLFFIFGKQ